MVKTLLLLLLAFAGCSAKPSPRDGGADVVLDASVARTQTILAANQDHPSGIITGGGYVYWTNESGVRLRRCAASGCSGSPTAIVSTNDIYVGGLAVDPISVY